jgi:hypothetical protein
MTMSTIPHNSTIVTMSTYNWETDETTLNVPQMDARQRLRSALGFAAAAARRRFPSSHGRIDAASRLIVDGKVVLHTDGTASVGSEAGDTVYTVNGHCTCPDAARAPEGWCKHRLAQALVKKALRLVEEWSQATAAVVVAAQEIETEEMPKREPVREAVRQPACPEFPPADDIPDLPSAVPVVESEVSPIALEADNASTGILERFVTHIQGKPFIQFQGLLALAHQQGLLALTEEVTHVTETYVMASARAEFHDGRVFRGVGDSSPDNVGAKVKPHWRRLAGTRAMARALRNALNVAMVAVEELE